MRNISQSVQSKMIDGVDFLKSYYQRKELSIFEFSDYYYHSFDKRNKIRCLTDIFSHLLSYHYFTPQVVQLSSPLVYHPKYLDYILQGNLSLEDVELSRMYGVVGGLEKICKRNSLPLFLSQMGKRDFLRKDTNSNQFVTDLLYSSPEVLFFYSVGGSCLEEHVGGSMLEILRSRLQLNQSVQYYQYYCNMIDDNYISFLISQVENNFEYIYSICPNADFVVFGCSVPNVYFNELEPYREMFLQYNYKLRQLCQEYGAMYIDSTYCNNHFLDAISKIVHFLYERKKCCLDTGVTYDDKLVPRNKNNLDFVIDALCHDYNKHLDEAQDAYEYCRDSYIARATSDYQARTVFERVKRYHHPSWKNY